MDKWSGFSTRHLKQSAKQVHMEVQGKNNGLISSTYSMCTTTSLSCKAMYILNLQTETCLIHSHTMFQTLKHKYWPCPKSVDHGRRIFHGLRLTLLTLSPKNQHYHHTSSPTCCSTIGLADFGPVEIELRSSLTTYMLQLLHVVALAPGIPMSNGLLVSTSWVQYPSIPACQLRSPTGKGSSPSLRNNGR